MRKMDIIYAESSFILTSRFKRKEKIVKSGKKCDLNFSDSMEIHDFFFVLCYFFRGINEFAYFSLFFERFLHFVKFIQEEYFMSNGRMYNFMWFMSEIVRKLCWHKNANIKLNRKVFKTHSILSSFSSLILKHKNWLFVFSIRVSHLELISSHKEKSKVSSDTF